MTRHLPVPRPAGHRCAMFGSAPALLVEPEEVLISRDKKNRKARHEAGFSLLWRALEDSNL